MSSLALCISCMNSIFCFAFFFFKQKTAYEIGLGIPAEPLFRSRPLKDIRDEYNYPKKKGIKDECSRLLEASTMKSRRGFAIQRLMNAMRQAHADGWFSRNAEIGRASCRERV